MLLISVLGFGRLNVSVPNGRHHLHLYHLASQGYLADGQDLFSLLLTPSVDLVVARGQLFDMGEGELVCVVNVLILVLGDSHRAALLLLCPV